jgi:DNA invertase Pin-like site-specific DNA recombinase
VEEQLAACRALAATLGYAVDDGATIGDEGPNTSLARPGITTLIGLVARDGAAAVIVHTLDRLGRPESEGLEALLREFRRRAVPIYIARTPKGYDYDPATGKLRHDPVAVAAANREDWRPPEYIVIPHESEQDDHLADRLLFRNGKAAPGSST